MWFPGYCFLILSVIVEVYLWWKLQASLIFLGGRTFTIGCWLNTFLPHCIQWQLFVLSLTVMPCFLTHLNLYTFVSRWVTEVYRTNPLLFPKINNCKRMVNHNKLFLWTAWCDLLNDMLCLILSSLWPSPLCCVHNQSSTLFVSVCIIYLQ